MNRTAALILITSLMACEGASDDVPAADAPSPIDTASFVLDTPAQPIQPRSETTFCYYTSVPTTAALGIKRWSSTMTQGSHHVTLYFTDDTTHADGTISQDCGAGVPYWVYGAQSPVAELVMPPGVGMTVPAKQKVYIQLHYINATDEVLLAQAHIAAEAYAPDEAYAPAAAFVTYRSGFSVPGHQRSSTSGSCAVPADTTFFALTTHTHRLGVHTTVRDGNALVFESDDWEHPGLRQWENAPFYRFATGHLTYGCEYDNPNTAAVSEGPSATANEMCMAIGYQTPATKPTFCFNDTVLP